MTNIRQHDNDLYDYKQCYEFVVRWHWEVCGGPPLDEDFCHRLAGFLQDGNRVQLEVSEGPNVTVISAHVTGGVVTIP